MGVYLRGKSWYIDFYYEGKRYTEKVGKVSKSIAEEKQDIKRSEVIRGEWKPKVKKISFEDFKRQYLEYSRANKKPESARRDGISLKPLGEFFKGRFLSEINPFMIEKYKQKRKQDRAARFNQKEEGEPISVRTINIELSCLRHMFTMAVKWGKAQKNPASEVKLFKQSEGKDRILLPDEETRLFDAIRLNDRSHRLELLVITALATGMRKNEVKNLRWPNVDLDNRVITVEGTKNGKVRKIPMNARLTEALSGAKKMSKGEYVFESERGRPYKSFRTAWDNVLRKAGIEGLTFHSLRHTFGTRLGMAGTDLGTIQELMGHADLKMVKRYYHPTAKHKREAVEALDRVTTFFTTHGVDREEIKIVNIIGNQ